jgi:hypothetical protein
MFAKNVAVKNKQMSRNDTDLYVFIQKFQIHIAAQESRNKLSTKVREKKAKGILHLRTVQY